MVMILFSQSVPCLAMPCLAEMEKKKDTSNINMHGFSQQRYTVDAELRARQRVVWCWCGTERCGLAWRGAGFPFCSKQLPLRCGWLTEKLGWRSESLGPFIRAVCDEADTGAVLSAPSAQPVTILPGITPLNHSQRPAP